MGWVLPKGVEPHFRPQAESSGVVPPLRSQAARGLPRGAWHEGLERFRPMRRLPRGIPSAYGCVCLLLPQSLEGLTSPRDFHNCFLWSGFQAGQGCGEHPGTGLCHLVARDVGSIRERAYAIWWHGGQVGAKAGRRAGPWGTRARGGEQGRRRGVQRWQRDGL